MDLEEAQTFVEMSSKPIDDTNRYGRCVDGRYENIQNCPMIAKPGGDVGDVMVAFAALNLLQLSLPSETVFSSVLEVVGGVKNFNFHTDDHSEPSDVGFGCGHFRLAKENPQDYGVTAEQMEFIAAQLPAMVEQGAHQEVLHGDHAEEAVIVVDSQTHGVLPLIRLGPTMREAFIYQKTFHTQQLDRLSQILQEALATAGQVVEEPQIRKAIEDAFGKQLTETLKRLAKGLPVYTAMIDSDGGVSIAS